MKLAYTCILFICVSFSSVYAQMGTYFIKVGGLDSLAPANGEPVINNKSRSLDLKEWMDTYNWNRDTSWIPEADETLYAVFGIRAVSYWFGPFDDPDAQNQAHNRLVKLSTHSAFDSVKSYISIYLGQLQPGKRLGEVFRPMKGGGMMMTFEQAKKLGQESREFEISRTKAEELLKGGIQQAGHEKADQVIQEVNEWTQAISNVQQAIEACSSCQQRIEELRGQYGKGEKGGEKGEREERDEERSIWGVVDCSAFRLGRSGLCCVHLIWFDLI